MRNPANKTTSQDTYKETGMVLIPGLHRLILLMGKYFVTLGIAMSLFKYV